MHNAAGRRVRMMAKKWKTRVLLTSTRYDRKQAACWAIGWKNTPATPRVSTTRGAGLSPEQLIGYARAGFSRVMKKDGGSENLSGDALIKEVNRRIRLARSYWDAHRNSACRTERERALKLYDTLSKAEKEKIPQVLRVWLRYRSEKYFNDTRTPPGGGSRK
jgi:hypothetical protein